jgi:FkbM family methyltransferase
MARTLKRLLRGMRLLKVTRRPSHLLTAVITRSDQPLQDFIRLGGTLRSGEVAYAGTTVPLRYLGPGFWLLDHLRDFIDAGGTIAHDGEDYVLTAPGGRQFTTSASDLGNAIGVLAEVFVRGEYEWLDVKDRVVVDIGGNIGDTALYFAGKGAAHVYAYEPFGHIHRAAERNVGLAGLDNVTLVNAAVGASSATLRVKDAGWTIRGSSDDDGEVITIRSLADVLNSAVTAHPGMQLACKVDCEGYEHELFRKGVADFSLVGQWMIEVHEQLGNVPDTLVQAGFDVSVKSKGNVWIVCAGLARAG